MANSLNDWEVLRRSARQLENELDSPLEVESKSIDHSTVLIEEQIDAARRTRETLLNQRSNLESMHSKLGTLANTFPRLGFLLHRIMTKKRNDLIIMSLVIGICLFLLILYIF